MNNFSGTNALLNNLTAQSVKLSHTDERSDPAITQAICNPPPVTSERNVWAFWDTGFATMRPWAQRNVIGWVKLLGPEWTVRVLDRVDGSPANIFEFVSDKSLIPACLSEGQMSGRYSAQHASDMIRLPLVFIHGGVWMDVGIMLFMHLDQVCWSALMRSSSKYELALASADPSLMTGLAENFFIAARKGNKFLRRWIGVFLEAWKGRSTCEGIHKHPLFKHLIEKGNVARFLRDAQGDKLDYFGAYLAYERLRLLEDPNDGFSGPNYCRNSILLIEYREFASAAMLTHDDGRVQFQHLKTRSDRGENTREYSGAQDFCKYMLSQCMMMKLYHWKADTVTVPTLAELWDKPENRDADHEKGTFAECLRYVSTHYAQKRKFVPLRFPAISESTINAGLLEAR